MRAPCEEPYWKRLPVDLRADVLETHYLTAKECLEQAARERDRWEAAYREWLDVALTAQARVAELERAVADAYADGVADGMIAMADGGGP